MDIIYYVSFVVSILFIWFNTDAFVEYAALLNVKLEDYHKTGTGKTFPQYIQLKRLHIKNRCLKFLMKLVSCPVCLAFILSLVACIFTGNIFNVFITYLSSLFVYFWLLKAKNDL